MWADSGPEVFELPSGAGDIEDDSFLGTVSECGAEAHEYEEGRVSSMISVKLNEKTMLARSRMRLYWRVQLWQS